MCNLSSGIWNDGMAKGVAERGLKDIMKLMQNLGLSAEQAMNLLEIPEEERQKYKEQLS